MSDKRSPALQLADELSQAWHRPKAQTEAAAELRRLDDVEIEAIAGQDTIIQLGAMLREIVNAIRGVPAPNFGHSTHDSVELVRSVIAERNQLRDMVASLSSAGHFRHIAWQWGETESMIHAMQGYTPPAGSKWRPIYARDDAPDGPAPTGWPPGLLQDDSTKLSKWLASKPDAAAHAREAGNAIKKQRESTDLKAK